MFCYAFWMGRVQQERPGMPELHVSVSTGLHQRVWQASRKAEQSVSAWVRMAILEKLEREGR
jgi:hypothetical protein